MQDLFDLYFSDEMVESDCERYRCNSGYSMQSIPTPKTLGQLVMHEYSSK